MTKGSRKYRLMMAALDEAGITTCINRIGPKRYQMIVNYEIIKEYKLRRTCNTYITKLYNDKVETGGNTGKR